MKRILTILAILAITITLSHKFILKQVGKIFAPTYFNYLSCPKSRFEGNNLYHSQVYEDYVLANIFSDQDVGFYVDVGTNDPTSNVTTYFYEKGWSGMNFEPVPRHYNQLLSIRASDININKAVSDEIGSAKFYIPAQASVLSSLSENIQTKLPKDIKEKHIDELVVNVTSLTEEFDHYNVGEIDFIKIDVEGFEDKVVKGLDFKKYRPKIVLLEYDSPVDRYGYKKFEPIMLENNYKLGLDDGLNRYYYREESPEFGPKLAKLQKCVNLSGVSRGARKYYYLFK